MKRRKVHPADAADAAVPANAIRYEVALFLGTGCYAPRSAVADLDIDTGEVGNTRLRLQAH